MSFFRDFFFRLRAWKKINKLFTGLVSVRIVKNCHLDLKTFSRPRSQFFTIRTSQPANNIHIRFKISKTRQPKYVCRANIRFQYMYQIVRKESLVAFTVYILVVSGEGGGGGG